MPIQAASKRKSADVVDGRRGDDRDDRRGRRHEQQRAHAALHPSSGSSIRPP